MGLSPDLISQFTELTNNREKTKKETTVYGEIVDYGGKNYVQLDGSELFTPIITTVEVKPGDRVTVLLKNHTATVTGNITSPAAQTETVKVVVKDIEDLSSHTSNSDIHVTSEEKTSWDAKANQSDIPTKTSDLTNDSGFVDSEDLSNHTSNSDIHVTSEEKAAWNAVNYSNLNLLINPDFQINQLGQTDYEITGFTVDRWLSQKFFTITPITTGIRIVPVETISENLYGLCQNVPFSTTMRGNDYTLTVNVAETNDYAHAVIYAYNTANSVVKSSDKIKLQTGINRVTIKKPPDTTAYIRVQFTIDSGAQSSDVLEVSWAKLELGSIATPFVPPDSATELLRIQAMDGTIPSDTVDGKHANEFMQFLGDFRSGSILEKVLTLNGSGYIYFGSANCTDMPVDGQYYLAEVRKLSTSYEIVATQFGSGTIFTNRYNGASKVWYGWKNVADGGNADTIDGKHASDFSQIISFGDTPTDTKTAIGIPFKTTAYWCSHWTYYPAALQDGQGIIIAVNYKGSGTVGTDNIWCRQIYITPHNSKIYQRLINKTTVGEWTNIADGGNAASVGVYTEAKLAELEARLDLLDGDHTIG